MPNITIKGGLDDESFHVTGFFRLSPDDTRLVRFIAAGLLEKLGLGVGSLSEMIKRLQLLSGCILINDGGRIVIIDYVKSNDAFCHYISVVAIGVDGKLHVWEKERSYVVQFLSPIHHCMILRTAPITINVPVFCNKCGAPFLIYNYKGRNFMCHLCRRKDILRLSLDPYLSKELQAICAGYV